VLRITFSFTFFDLVDQLPPSHSHCTVAHIVSCECSVYLGSDGKRQTLLASVKLSDLNAAPGETISTPISIVAQSLGSSTQWIVVGYNEAFEADEDHQLVGEVDDSLFDATVAALVTSVSILGNNNNINHHSTTGHTIFCCSPIFHTLCNMDGCVFVHTLCS
jgi:hypothetical protein